MVEYLRGPQTGDDRVARSLHSQCRAEPRDTTTWPPALGLRRSASCQHTPEWPPMATAAHRWLPQAALGSHIDKGIIKDSLVKAPLWRVGAGRSVADRGAGRYTEE